MKVETGFMCNQKYYLLTREDLEAYLAPLYPALRVKPMGQHL